MTDTTMVHAQDHARHLKQIEKRSTNARRLCRLLKKHGVNPKSMIDIGCGYGFLLSEAKKTWEMDRVVGMDGSWVGKDDLLLATSEFVVTDLEQEFEIPGRFDLATCMEVAEHLKPDCAEQLVQKLTEAADVIMFSAAIPGQRGTGHVNLKFLDYWAGLFAKRNYKAVDILHAELWPDEDMFIWFRQNVAMFVAESELQKRPNMVPYVVDPTMLARVHPKFLTTKLRVIKDLKNRIRELEIKLEGQPD